MDDGSGLVTMIPSWMLDPVVCVGMRLGEPRVAVAALRELHDLLVARGLRGNSSNDFNLVQEECDESELRDCSAAASDAGRDTASEQPGVYRTLVLFDWTLIRYRNVISVLKNPFYAGVYVYGKSEKRTVIRDGRAHRSYGHGKPFDDWEEFERNQKQIAANAYGKAGDVKSGRGGAALLSGLLACARCGRRLSIAYRGHAPRQTVYRCNSMDLTGRARCMTFGGSRVDAAIAKELLRAVQPMAIEAATEAERMHMQTLNEQQRVVELELEQARYEARIFFRGNTPRLRSRGKPSFSVGAEFYLNSHCNHLHLPLSDHSGLKSIEPLAKFRGSPELADRDLDRWL